MIGVKKYCFIFILFFSVSFVRGNTQESAHKNENSNINGFMPQTLYISTLTQAFCKGFEFSVYDGKIWTKKPEQKEWSLFLGTGVPYNPKTPQLAGKDWFAPAASIKQIAADGDAVFAFDDKDLMYRCYTQDYTADRPFEWLNNFGWPQKQILKKDARFLKARSWGIGVRRKDVLWYTDRYGNEHHYGTMGLETIYFLSENGQEIRFTDSGLPAAFSKTILGPERGSFISENMSVSGSTLFLINGAGEMYTRLIDYDTMGCDPMFFKYTYNDEKYKYSGTDYRSNYTPWGLPNEDWKKQPDIPLTGRARLSKYISIIQNGRGNSARELRVAGLSPEGKTGFYHKQIDESDWKFTSAALHLEQTSFLPYADQKNSTDKSIRASLRGNKHEFSYVGHIYKGDKKIDGFTCRIPDFTLTTEGSCSFIIYDKKTQKKKRALFYPLEIWTYITQDDPGFDGTTRNFFITPEFSQELLEDQEKRSAEQANQKDMMTLPPVSEPSGLGASPADFGMHSVIMSDASSPLLPGASANTGQNPSLTDIFREIFDGTNKKLYAFTAHATTDYIEIDCKNSMDYNIFLTKEETDLSPAEYKTNIYFKHPLVENSVKESELLLPLNKTYTVFDAPEIYKKIQNNKEQIQKLSSDEEIFQAYSRNATRSRWGYSLVDFLTTITLLNKIDFPKIKTLTSYGNTIMTTNAASMQSLAEYRSFIYPFITRLIQKRIEVYDKLLKDILQGKTGRIDPRLKNSYFEYFEEAGLPPKQEGYSPLMSAKATIERYPDIPLYAGMQLSINTKNDSLIILIEIPDLINAIFTQQKDNIRCYATLRSMTENKDKTKMEKRLKEFIKNGGYFSWDGSAITIYASDKKTVLFEGLSAHER
ncbi:hypothetical protein HRI96_04785 [Treponema parvum]|uniref:Uncharacterized protein n=1 Tax=Treponema parvum TaxID=138851 RepID=A0A975ICY3_9SPIR|nr:hypothetical protein [Treponema parvum]QTQ11579.1 hypothetical protein HRI96_04785 [Treponema parvum]